MNKNFYIQSFNETGHRNLRLRIDNVDYHVCFIEQINNFDANLLVEKLNKSQNEDIFSFEKT